MLPGEDSTGARHCMCKGEGSWIVEVKGGVSVLRLYTSIRIQPQMQLCGDMCFWIAVNDDLSIAGEFVL